MDKRVGGREVSRFLFKNFLSHSAAKFRKGTLQCVNSFGYRMILRFRDLCHALCRICFISQCLNVSLSNPSDLCFTKFSVAKKFMDKMGLGGVSRFSVDFFLSLSAENFHRGTLLCCVSEDLR